MSDVGAGTGSRVAANAAWIMVGDLFGKVASFVLVVILARGLGQAQYGDFNFGLSFIALFLQLARWGVEVTTVRVVSADPEELSEAFVNGLAVRSVLSLLALAAAVALSPFFVKDSQTIVAVMILGGALFLDEIRVFFGAFFIAFERMRFNAIALFINRVLSTVLALVVVALHGGLVPVCVTYLLGSLGATLSCWVAFRRFFPPVKRKRIRLASARLLLRNGAAYGFAAFFNMAAFRIDAVMLEGIKGSKQVGIYSVAYRFFEPLLFVTWGLASACLPRFVRDDRAGGRTRTYELGMAALLAFYLPIAAGEPFAGRWIVKGLFGSLYVVAVPAVGWLTAAAALYGVAHFTRMALIAYGRRREILWVAAIALAVNVGVNAAVIPRYGFVGAAAVTFWTEVAECGLLLGYYVTTVDAIHSWRPLAVPVVATVAMALVLVATDAHGAAALGVAAIAYPAALALAGFLIDRDDAGRIASRVLDRLPGQRPDRPATELPPGTSGDASLAIEAVEASEDAGIL